jgi:hypothetical protein
MNTCCAHALEDAVAEDDSVVAEGCLVRHTSAYLRTYERICSKGGGSRNRDTPPKKKNPGKLAPTSRAAQAVGGKKRARCPLEKA